MYGTDKWYCEDCKVAISEDPVNKRDWELRHRPMYHADHFSTREQIAAGDTNTGELPKDTPRPIVIDSMTTLPGGVTGHYLDGLNDIIGDAIAAVTPKQKHDLGVIGGYTEIKFPEISEESHKEYVQRLGAKLGVSQEALSELLNSDFDRYHFADAAVAGGLLDDTIRPAYRFQDAPIAPDKLTRQQRRAQEREDRKNPPVSSVKNLSNYRPMTDKGRKRHHALRGK
jgi:hypothetical protein